MHNPETRPMLARLPACVRALILVLLVGVAAAPVARAATYYVRAGGQDTAAGTTPQAAFRTLQRAAEVLNHGDHVVLGPGTYRGNVLIAERHSADGAAMTITGDESGAQTGDPAGPVVLEAASLASPALHLHRFRNLVLSGLTFRGGGDGLLLERCLGVTVERCTFQGMRRGLSAKDGEGLAVLSSVFSQCTIGLSLQAVTGTSLAHLTLTNSSCAGLLVLACGAGSVRNSILAENNTNFIVDKSSAPGWSSDHNVISGTSGPWGLVPMVYFTPEWFAASGQDRHSVYVVPEFVDIARGDVRPSPAVTWPGGLPGQQAGTALQPAVERDRAGRPFRVSAGRVCVGAYEYPDPQPAPGWKALGVALDPAAGVRQSAGLYRADGTLVRTLVADTAGVGALWWDGRDDSGQPAPAGDYEVRAAAHDIRVADDGTFGDNGSPLGTYHCDNPQRLAVLPDGRFAVTTHYDEAGIPVRFYASTGVPVSGVNLAEKNIWAIAVHGDEFIAGIGDQVVRLVPPGDRALMASGARGYPILAAGEKLNSPAERYAGLTVRGNTAMVALAGRNVIRVFDLGDGRRLAEWPVPAVADLASDEAGTVWAISGTDVVALGADGAEARRHASGLAAPRFLAAGTGRLAVVDQAAGRIALLAADSGRVLKTLGAPAPAGEWTPVSAERFLNPRGVAFLPDGRLLVAEAGRTRAIWPDTAQTAFVLESNFMDVAVPHPLKPEYVYCHGGMAFHVDPRSGAWSRILDPPAGAGLGSLSTNVVLAGRPFLVSFNPGRSREVTQEDGQVKKIAESVISFIDVTDPLKPRLAGELTQPVAWAYASISFTREGHLVSPGGSRSGGYALRFRIAPFLGLDAAGNPQYDLAAATVVGVDPDPAPRGMGHNSGITVDPGTDDFYYMAVTAQHNKMVPAWGASGSGVGRSRADGEPLWFSLSSGGNYTSLDCVRTGEQLWVLAGKDFGGQLDLFDADGLRLATGNWAWPCNWQMGFVDLRFAVQAYIRPDGKPGAYVEDDNIGRFARARVDGADTLRRQTLPVAWAGGEAAPAAVPVADRVAAPGAGRLPIALPRVPALPVDGRWDAWAAAGVVPQIISLPTVTFGRSWPDDLFQTFRAGTAIGALAHDGENLYAYFVVADDTMSFDTDNPGMMWMVDSVELWLEEEQIGLGLLSSGKPALFKYRYHNREGREWAANYPLAQENVWGATLDSLAAHPLGRQLGEAAGVSFEGKPGYALMAKIPFAEVKLVGGVPGREGKAILPLTGAAGEILRVGVAFDGINRWGREQDFKVYWPIGLMFSDPTRNVPFVFGP
jgi:hypothetical protein